MDAARLLLIEDDAVIGEGLRDTLEAEGYDVCWERTGRAGLAAATAHRPEVVLLDLGLDDLDGIEVCRRLRGRHPDSRIVIVTARRAEMDAVLGLDAGADDYVIKPFRLAELLARVRANLRRNQADTDDELTAGAITLDVAAHRAFDAGAELDLRPKEYDLLALLVRNAGRAVTRERIMREVWDTEWYGSTKSLDMHISSLRAKLADPHDGGRITTLRGVGYRLDAR